jgi:hypothetical protein
MTLAELEDTLPNGFHDAFIYAFSIDYKDQKLDLDMELSYSQPDDPPEVPNKRVIIRVSGLKLFAVDPPDPQYGALDGDELFVQGFVTASSEHWKNSIDPKLVEAPGSDAPLYSFFVDSWNSCIHIAATDAVCIWSDELATSTVK